MGMPLIIANSDSNPGAVSVTFVHEGVTKWSGEVESDEVTFEIGQGSRTGFETFGAYVVMRHDDLEYGDSNLDDDGEGDDKEDDDDEDSTDDEDGVEENDIYPLEAWSAEVRPINYKKTIPWPINTAYEAGNNRLKVTIDCPEGVKVRCQNMQFQEKEDGSDGYACPEWIT